LKICDDAKMVRDIRGGIKYDVRLLNFKSITRSRSNKNVVHPLVGFVQVPFRNYLKTTAPMFTSRLNQNRAQAI
jgi:hypothetical protein